MRPTLVHGVDGALPVADANPLIRGGERFGYLPRWNVPDVGLNDGAAIWTQYPPRSD